MLQGLATFTGIDPREITGCDYTRGHGVSPGVATLSVRPNFSTAAELGTLTLSFDKTKMEFKNCAIVNGRAARTTGSGFVWSIRVVDRRWAWQYTHISGRYNARDDNGDIDETLYKKKTPQELAKLLLEAMGEDKPDVSKLPNDTLPEVNWADTRADVALQSLAESLGCRIVLGLDDKVKIVRLGEGKELPTDDDAQSFSVGHERAAQPGKIRIAFGPNIYEAKWELEPLGEDTDGTLKPIDELSYKPAGGWGRPDEIDDPASTYTRDGVELYTIDLAEKTVYRYWRIKNLVDYPAIDVDFVTLAPSVDKKTPEIGNIRQVFLNDTLAKPDKSGNQRPAVLEGQFTRYADDGSEGSTPAGTRWPGTFTIDRDLRLVILGDSEFDYPYMTNSDDDTVTPAKFYLTTSYTVVGSETGALLRYDRERKLSKNPGVATEKAPYLSRTIRQVYKGATDLDEVLTNTSTVNEEADKLLKQLESTLKPRKAQDIQYRGLRKDIDLDGAIQQITYSLGTTKATTTRVGRNNEPVLRVKSYEERSRIAREKAREAAAAVEKVTETAKAAASGVLERLKFLLPGS